ncbi:hypothetical protein CHS0354_014150 [Potamilus streckersoni]|uniref:Uncharacterized protein n=1 Tax=Potamilus streckersoni TaxID=2493646 RepID=A0AAE0TJS9_9BIVA|nr:hypothetical protein CHS0354_014150 [Potamilus streckersoni]
MVKSGNLLEAAQIFRNGDLPSKSITKLLQTDTFPLNEAQNLLSKLAEMLKSAMENKIKHVWVGYRRSRSNVPVFVLISYNNGVVISAEDIPESYPPFECVIRQEYEVSSEAREITNNIEARQILIVHKIALQPGSASEVGIDAAMVKITSDWRLQDRACFQKIAVQLQELQVTSSHAIVL